MSGAREAPPPAAVDAAGSGERAARRDLREVGRGAATFLLGQVVRRGLQYGLLLVLARTLGEAGLGLVVLAATVVQLLGTSLGAGLRDALIREIAGSLPGEPARAARAARAGAMLGQAAALPIGLSLWLLAEPIARVGFRKPEAAGVVALAGGVIPLLVALHWGLAVLRALRRVDLQVAVEDGLWPGLTLLVAAALVVAVPTPERAVAGLVIAAPLSAAVAASLAWRRLEEAGIPTRVAGTVTALPAFALLAGPLVGSGFLSTAGMWLDSLLLGALAPSEDLGVYGPVSRLALALPIVLFAFNSLFSPVAARRLALGGPSAVGPLFRTVARWTFGGTLLGAGLLVTAGRDVLALFGPGFVRGYPALLVLAFAGLVNGAVGSAGVLLKMGGRQAWLLVDGVVSQGVALALAVALIPRHGLMGAAVSAAAGSLILQVAMVVQVRVFFGLSPFGRHYFAPAAAGLASLGGGAAAHAALGGAPLGVRFAAVVGVSVAAFMGVLGVSGLRGADRDVLRGLLGRPLPGES